MMIMMYNYNKNIMRRGNIISYLWGGLQKQKSTQSPKQDISMSPVLKKSDFLKTLFC